MICRSAFLTLALTLFLYQVGTASDNNLQPFLEKHCVECHDADSKKGGLDLTELKFELTNPKSFSTWVKVHDRTINGEMPREK